MSGHHPFQRLVKHFPEEGKLEVDGKYSIDPAKLSRRAMPFVLFARNNSRRTS
jgi:hypothetical protein